MLNINRHAGSGTGVLTEAPGSPGRGDGTVRRLATEAVLMMEAADRL